MPQQQDALRLQTQPQPQTLARALSALREGPLRGAVGAAGGGPEWFPPVLPSGEGAVVLLSSSGWITTIEPFHLCTPTQFPGEEAGALPPQGKGRELPSPKAHCVPSPGLSAFHVIKRSHGW